ncbi:hypothetical protein CEXT_406391 [Caerostris extrusa]|uniref:Uncharacterized protein n=1 Tax=Caerostris extrusa TaxID=172846 RepID=A0AAV4QP54_CAEEX|nr:hypothetical protein CEXT_406391 [Caerostris extrusa]
MSSAAMYIETATRYFRQFPPKSDNMQRGTHAYYCTQEYGVNSHVKCRLRRGLEIYKTAQRDFEILLPWKHIQGIRVMSSVKLSLHFGINIGRNGMVNGESTILMQL